MASTPVDMKATVDESSDSAVSTPSQPVTKSEVIDQELHRYGMGRYQWFMWAVCSSGFFLDVMWSQSFSLAVPNLQRELGFSDKEFGSIISSFAAGLTAGSFVWGVLSDVVGRRVAFLGTSLIAGAFGICLGALSSYEALLVATAFTGVGIGGNIPIDTTLTMEYIPADRFYLLTTLAFNLPLGSLIIVLIAFGFISNYSCSVDLVSCRLTGGVEPCCSKDANMGWRYLFFTTGSITLAVFIFRFFIFPFHESPKFLLSKGNDQGAVDVVHKVAAFNRHPCDLTVDSLCERSKEAPAVRERGPFKRALQEIRRMKHLFGDRRTLRVAIHVWITWIFNAFGYYTGVAFLPTILQLKNGAIGVSIKQTYIDYVIIYAPGLVAVALSILMVRTPALGRKWTLVASSVVMGVSLFMYSLVNTQAGFVGLNVLEFFCQFIFSAALWGWTPEAFPTAVRGTATGVALFFSGLFGIVAPLIAGQLFSRPNGSNNVLFLAGSVIFVCSISIITLPTKYMLAPR